jgi:DNA-binding transcriptional MerR regulator
MEQLFSSKDVAAKIGVNLATVRKWVQRGKLKPRPKIIGGAYVFTQRDVEQLSQRADERRK